MNGFLLSQAGAPGPEAPPASPGAAVPSFLQSPLVPLIGVAVIFYFFIIRPARRRQKDMDLMIANLKNGDRVITQGGIFGTVMGVDDQKVQLRIADQVKIDVAKSAIAGLAEPDSKK